MRTLRSLWNVRLEPWRGLWAADSSRSRLRSRSATSYSALCFRSIVFRSAPLDFLPACMLWLSRVFCSVIGRSCATMYNSVLFWPVYIYQYIKWPSCYCFINRWISEIMRNRITVLSSQVRTLVLHSFIIFCVGVADVLTSGPNPALVVWGRLMLKWVFIARENTKAFHLTGMISMIAVKI